MISQADYRRMISGLAPKFSNININWDEWYKQFVYYEDMWGQYFKDFLTHRPLRKDPVSVVLWESCPGGLPFPHPNYAFDVHRFDNPIHGTFDKYLKTVCDTFEVPWKTPESQNKKIGDLIRELNQKRVLIVDVYPTHGITLDNENRARLCNEIFPKFSAPKIKQILNQLHPEQISAALVISRELHNAGITKHFHGENLPFNRFIVT